MKAYELGIKAADMNPMLTGGLIGAPAGAALLALLSPKGKRVRGAVTGAIGGGALGTGLGALSNAYKTTAPNAGQAIANDKPYVSLVDVAQRKLKNALERVRQLTPAPGYADVRSSEDPNFSPKDIVKSLYNEIGKPGGAWDQGGKK